MPGTEENNSSSGATCPQTFPFRPEDERKAASIAGLCDTFLREAGFSLIEVGSDYAAYRSGSGHRITVRGNRWFCKLSSGAELSGVGFLDLSEVVRGGENGAVGQSGS